MSSYPFRKVDWGVLLSFLLVLGIIYEGLGKPIAWNQACKDVSELKPKVEKDSEDIRGIKDVQSTQMAFIIRELDSMHKDIREIKRQGSGG